MSKLIAPTLKEKMNDLDDADLGFAISLFARCFSDAATFWKVMDMPVRWVAAYLNAYSIDDKGLLKKLQ